MIINSFSKKLFQNFDAVYPQNNETRKYLKKLGCKNIKIIGNLKYSNYQESLKEGIKKNIFKNKIIWCASSTHKTEELIAANVHKELKKKIKNLLTIIIPRHVNRKDEILNALKNYKLKIHLHSSKINMRNVKIN